MPSVSPSSPSFAAIKSTAVEHPHRVSFGERPVKAVIVEHRVKVPPSQSPDRMRRLFAPSLWILGGVLLTVGTAGILHFIGLPLIAVGAYKAYKRW